MSHDPKAQEFINKMEAKYPGRFLYHNIKYVNAHTLISVQCTVCQEYSDLKPNKMLSAGAGCLPCSGRHSFSNVENFLKKAHAVHGDTYQYHRVTKVTRGSDRVEVYCPVHDHYFSPTAVAHVNQQSGCPKCGGSEQLTTETFIAKAEECHPGKYSYEKVSYVNNKKKVSVFCKKHNEYFDITPAAFLSGQGCAKCGVHGFQQNKPAVVYVLRLTSPDKSNVVYKVGITGDMKTRMQMQASKTEYSIEVMYTINFELGKDALDVERECKQICSTGTLSKEEYGDGHSETMTEEEYQKVSLILNEFSGKTIPSSRTLLEDDDE